MLRRAMTKFSLGRAMAKFFRALPPELRWPVIGGLIVAAIGALVLAPIGNWLQSQLTTHETNVDALRVTYYRVNGIGLRVLTDGCLTPAWLKIFGLHPSVVPNVVLDEVQRIFADYGTPVFYGDFLGGSYPKSESSANDLTHIGEVAGCVKHEHPTFSVEDQSDWKVYLGSDLLIPDDPATKAVFETLDWPPNYEFSTTGFYPGLSIWRYLNSDDLAQYERHYQDYQTIAHQLFTYKGWRNLSRLVDSNDLVDSNEFKLINLNTAKLLRFITQGGVPEGFMAVIGEPNPHGFWKFHAPARELELLVAVYENASGSSIDVGDFSYKELTQRSLRTEKETNKQFEEGPITNKTLYPIRTLKPGEFILVPLRIQFVLPATVAPPFNPTKPTRASITDLHIEGEGTHRVSFHRVGGEDILSYEVPTYAVPGQQNYETIFVKRMSGYRDPKQARLVRRFDFGPAWNVESVVVNNTKTSSRLYDTEKFLLYAGAAKGSCPVVASFNPDLGLWQDEGEILARAMGENQRGDDKLLLRNFHGVLNIRGAPGDRRGV